MVRPAGEGRVCVGVIAGVHGVKGLVRVKAFTEVDDDLTAYGPLGDAGGQRHFDLAVIGRAKGMLLARITGVGDRDAAETLKGQELYVDRAALPPPAEDEFYHSDWSAWRWSMSMAAGWARWSRCITMAPAICWRWPAGRLSVCAVPRRRRAGRRSGRRRDHRRPAAGPAAGRPGDGMSAPPLAGALAGDGPDPVPRHVSGSAGPVARRQGLAADTWRLETVDIRAHARDRHRSVDDTPLAAARHGHARRCHRRRLGRGRRPAGAARLLTPRGRPLDQAWCAAGPPAPAWSCVRALRGFGPTGDRGPRLVEVSLGDFVLSGGEVAALHAGRLRALAAGVMGAATAPTRTVLKTVCWNIRFTPNRAPGRAGRCRKSCCPAITPKSMPGGAPRPRR